MRAQVRRRIGRPDLALIPIGAYAPRWFMQTAMARLDPAQEPLIAIGR